MGKRPRDGVAGKAAAKASTAKKVVAEALKKQPQRRKVQYNKNKRVNKHNHDQLNATITTAHDRGTRPTLTNIMQQLQKHITVALNTDVAVAPKKTLTDAFLKGHKSKPADVQSSDTPADAPASGDRVHAAGAPASGADVHAADYEVIYALVRDDPASVGPLTLFETEA